MQDGYWLTLLQYLISPILIGLSMLRLRGPWLAANIAAGAGAWSFRVNLGRRP